MRFIGTPINPKKNSHHINLHMIVTGLFIVFGYILSLLPLVLFAIAQTLAIFGKKYTIQLSLIVFTLLVVLSMITGYSPIILATFVAAVSMPIFFLVSVLRQKKTSILWSAGILILPLIVFFSAIIFAPVLNSAQYINKIERIENVILETKEKEKENQFLAKAKNDASYEQVISQLEILKKDNQLKKFLSYNVNQRLAYFLYGDGFILLLTVLLSFLASLFFLDFAFEQVEKLRAINRYVRSLPIHSFDPLFLLLLKDIASPKGQEHILKSNIKENDDFQIVKHINKNIHFNSQKQTFFGLLKKPEPSNTISFRNYIFYYTGKIPGWGLRVYQIPLIFCFLSIMLLGGIIFYFGNAQSIIDAIAAKNPFSTSILLLSILAMCVLSFLMLQGIFTILRWVPFSLLVFISIVFLLLAPYIAFNIGPFLFLGVFGVTGLLGYLK